MPEYIEREAVIEKLRTMPIPKQAGRANTWLDNCASGVNATIREVAQFPAADVAPVVHGRWKYFPDCICTRCQSCDFAIEGYAEYSYCPNCGAKMDGGNTDDQG